jgi:hypothetical protein
MTDNKRVFLAPLALGLAMSLGGCGGDSSATQVYCPVAFTVTDADRLTHFREGAGRDPRDIAYEATLTGASTSCESRRGVVTVTLLMRISVAAGPSVAPGTTSVPYFVRVLDSSGAVTQGQEFTADFRLSAGNPRGASQEELNLRLPVDGGGYRIAVGLKPTAEELNYNRRGRSGQP